ARGPLELGDLGGLAAGGALPHGLGELHVAHAVLEGGARDRLAPADRVDELFLDAPADPPLGGNRDLAERLVAAPAARESPGVGLDPQRALGPEDPRLARWGQRRHRAEAHVCRRAAPDGRPERDASGYAHCLAD